MKHWKLWIALAAVTALIIGGIVWQSGQPESYKAVSVKAGKAVEAIYATAIVEPVTWAAIAPIRTGRITEVKAEEGDVVDTGDVLARLDDADLRAQLEETQALVEYYEDDLARAEELIKKGHISQEKYDAAKTHLAQNRARVHMFEEQIKQLALSAPMDGTVLWRDVELGEVKQAGEPLFWVGQPKPLRLEAEVDEEDIPKIKSGQNVLITADAFPKKVLDGLVHWISPKGDPVNKSYRVYMTLPEDTPLMIGMTVETNTIVQEKEGALLVPAEALLDDEAVWTAEKTGEGYKVRLVKIKTGIVGEEKVEIMNDLAEGDLVLLPPFDGLKNGAVIRLRK